jgi:hypothetical protein
LLNPSGIVEVGRLQTRALTIAALFASEDCLKILLIDGGFAAGIVDLQAAVQSLSIPVIRLIDTQIQPANSDRALAASRAALLQFEGVFWFLSEKSEHLNRQLWIDGAVVACEEISSLSVSFGAALSSRDELIVQIGLILGEIRSGKCELWFRMIESGDLDGVRKLILAGIDIRQKDGNDGTGLMRAVLRGNFELVRLLIEKGANMEDKDNDSWTSRMIAVNDRALEVVRLLIERGANLDVRDDDGLTGLMIAAIDGDAGTVKLLVEKGANLEEKRDNGWTALDWAKVFGRTNVAVLLRSSGDCLLE